MYVGRIAGVARTPTGQGGVFYRVSSRSYPHRHAVLLPGGAYVQARSGEVPQNNPYVTYRCLRYSERWAVVANGGHTDAVFERVESGFAPRDALSAALFAFDIEHDSLGTPRIAAVFQRGARRAFVGIIRSTGLQVEEVELPEGTAVFVCTYNLTRIGTPETRCAFPFSHAKEVIDALRGAPPFISFENPVCAVCALETATGFASHAGDYHSEGPCGEDAHR